MEGGGAPPTDAVMEDATPPQQQEPRQQVAGKDREYSGDISFKDFGVTSDEIFDISYLSSKPSNLLLEEPYPLPEPPKLLSKSPKLPPKPPDFHFSFLIFSTI
ncbi:unnamed protein product [Vicia faba]|uniref:Uncharacterized protein n=1 Tax=Vicia faba TaxID=3906 RepID=A0AAV1A4T3_VICFA|nr:unnamed protein product [Vicia faba]